MYFTQDTDFKVWGQTALCVSTVVARSSLEEAVRSGQGFDCGHSGCMKRYEVSKRLPPVSRLVSPA